MRFAMNGKGRKLPKLNFSNLQFSPNTIAQPYLVTISNRRKEVEVETIFNLDHYSIPKSN